MGDVKSPLRYPGGKSRAVKFLSKFFPKDFKELREPMMGGASITFYWVQNKPSAKFLAGDINYDLICFWKELKENKDRLIKEIKRIEEQTKDGRELFKEITQRREERNLDSFQRAVDFFILNRITFSGTVGCGGYSEHSFKELPTWNSREKLERAHEIIKHVELFHCDYEELLDLEGQDVIIFLDPPYYSSSASKLYGKKGNLHTGFDHVRFYEAVKKCKHRVLITYDNSEFIRNLYKDFYLVEWQLSYSMNKSKVGSELLIANFPIYNYIEEKVGFC